MRGIAVAETFYQWLQLSLERDQNGMFGLSDSKEHPRLSVVVSAWLRPRCLDLVTDRHQANTKGMPTSR